ncbi:AAA family ATPase [Aeromonas enteropelogenes]|uniref:AAA family ATPase n=1 Tax=Aeromonas enteropelogenes TaxID=29489 RepID=UPI003BA04F89
MKILHVNTVKLHKYITTEIIFNDELSIVTGINGSGKTSILKLIEATLKLDINTVNSIAFELFTVKIEHENKEYNIGFKRESPEPNSGISFIINDTIITAESGNRAKNIFGERKSLIVENLVTALENELSNPSSDLHIFESIHPPMFIGLNRRISSKKIGILTQKNTLNYIIDEVDSIEKDSFDAALDDCKNMITNEFRRIKRYEAAQTNILRDQIITSSFTFFDSHNGLRIGSEITKAKFNEIMKRKGEILSVLNNFEMKDSTISSIIENFFTEISNLFNKASSKNQKGSKKDNSSELYSLEYFLNITQVERIYNLVKIIDKHKSELDERRKKIDSFIENVNAFFNETGKKLVINSIGNIYFSIGEKSNLHDGEDEVHKVEIDELSSGEKQLFIIISNMVFSKKSNFGAIIIDEPEISLHVRWQDMFIRVLRAINSDIQMILATHSPDIIGDYEDYCTPIMVKGV